MPVFSEFEKELIIRIAADNARIDVTLGWLVKDILFPLGEGAFAVVGVIQGTTQCRLLALADGGFTAKKMRERVVAFVSLMSFLEENRMVYLLERDSPIRMLFYQDSPNLALDAQRISHKHENGLYETIYQDQINESDVLRYKEIYTVTNNFIIASVEVRLGDGGTLDECGIDTQLKSQLLRFLTCSAYAGLSLTQLVADGFKTPEELKSEKSIELASKQVTSAQATLIVAILTLLFSAMLPLIQGVQATRIFLGAVSFLLIFALGFTVSKNNQ